MTQPGSPEAPPLSEAIRLSMADRLLNEENWAAALTLLELIDAGSPTASAAYAVKLAIAHCRIELAPAAALDNLVLAPCPMTGTHTEDVRRVRLQFRAAQLCQHGDFARARRLIRLLGAVDAHIATCLRENVDAGPSAALRVDWMAPGAAVEPPGIAAYGVAAPHIAAAKQRFAGTPMALFTR
ncbi:MAG: hypothetical protein JO021_09765, partial [Alphaproteobacteria bacterium]|nr:hypothetical protein [Alphaproteobacteria bacterium]